MSRFLVPALLTFLLPGVALPDEAALTDLGDALARFRGVGYADVSSYRVDVRLPEDPEEEPVALREVWRAPEEVCLRAGSESTPLAIVRSMALYLEPLYVARTSLLQADLPAVMNHLRSSGTYAVDGDSRAVDLPADPAGAPAEIADVSRIEWELDGEKRLLRLGVTLKPPDGRSPESVELRCEYAGPEPQPTRATWRLPGGEEVVIETEFARQGDRSLPAARRVSFPSRFEPGAREEIAVRYENFEIGAEVTDDELRGSGSFRYDENGLVTEDVGASDPASEE